jgi:tRNA pseudouridine(38-40) synthase
VWLLDSQDGKRVINIDDMIRATRDLEGTKIDMSAFAKRSNALKKKNNSDELLRTIESIDIEAIQHVDIMNISPHSNSNREIRIFFTAKSFVRNQIRILVHLLYKIGTGDIASDMIPEIIASKSRKFTDLMAPAHGLYLIDAKDELS